MSTNNTNLVFSPYFCEIFTDSTMKVSSKQEILKDFFHAAFSVDNVVFGFDEGDLKVLLIYRGAEPYKGMWALPGDLVRLDEDLDESALRVLQDLTGLKNIFMEQIHTFGKTDRHPFGRVITVAYYSLIKIQDYNINAASWAEEAKWFSILELPTLPFDHLEIIEFAKKSFKEKVRRQPIGFELLPKYFTLTQIQHLFESILQEKLDTRNFRKKLLAMDLLVDTKKLEKGKAHRPAALYKFDLKKYQKFQKSGFSFDL
jgi:8-oxo-dGTP diphosphatase